MRIGLNFIFIISRDVAISQQFNLDISSQAVNNDVAKLLSDDIDLWTSLIEGELRILAAEEGVNIALDMRKSSIQCIIIENHNEDDSHDDSVSSLSGQPSDPEDEEEVYAYTHAHTNKLHSYIRTCMCT